MIKKCGLYENGVVVNVILIDTENEYTPAEGLSIIDDERACIGYSVVDGVLVVPEPPPIEEQV